ncbi:hypothetical protein ACLB1M_04850 [Escherichia coli]
MMRMFNPPHPGEVLHDYLEGVSITQATSRFAGIRIPVIPYPQWTCTSEG